MARHGSLRASDADRDQIVERLRTASTEGRLAAEELEERVRAALIARTYAELDATVADLPGPRARRGREREPARRTVGGRALATARANPIAVVIALPFIAAIAAMVLAVTVMWMVLMCVVLVVGGRRRMIGPPWMHSHHLSHGRRRGPRSYWA
jgi:hypothetical protein